MILERSGAPLRAAEAPAPEPGAGQLLLRVRCCAVCRTDLHVVDGELPDPRLPLIPGHQIVGVVEQLGEHTDGFAVGDRVGVPWLGWTDGECRYCLSRRENLCENARFTGYQLDGGYAEYAVADARFCFPIPEGFPDLQAAPLLCAGLIGHRSLRFAGDGKRLGSSPGSWVPTGPGARKRSHPRNWTRRSSSRQSAHSFLPPSGPSPGAGEWSAQAYI